MSKLVFSVSNNSLTLSIISSYSFDLSIKLMISSLLIGIIITLSVNLSLYTVDWSGTEATAFQIFIVLKSNLSAIKNVITFLLILELYYKKQKKEIKNKFF